MIDEFARSLKYVLVHEGGYVNHPKDPGGATNQGVTQRVYDDFRKAAKKALRSVKEMLADERDAIYRTRYWNLIKGDALPSGISYVVFDGAVNSGVGQSVKWLQRALKIPADGVIGPQTIQAIETHPNHDAIVAEIIRLRERFLRALKTFKTFGKGWISRISGVKKVGQAWAMGDVGPAVQFVPMANAKAYISDAKQAPPKALGDASTGAGGITVTIAQATNELSPYANIEFVAKVLAGLTIAGVVVGVGGFVYREWAKRKQADLNDALGVAPT